MPKNRTEAESAAGKLILAVQKEWGAEIGDSSAAASEDVMHSAHDLLNAAKRGEVKAELNDRSVTEYLGAAWVGRHPAVVTAIRALESAIAAQRVE